MKFLLDMNLSLRWVPALAQVGYEAVPWRALGKPRASDLEIMAYARLHGFAVMTHDLDFGDLLFLLGADGPSVAQIRSEDIAVSRIVGLVVQGLACAADAIEQGALVSINPRGARVRLLPLRPTE